MRIAFVLILNRNVEILKSENKIINPNFLQIVIDFRTDLCYNIYIIMKTRRNKNV